MRFPALFAILFFSFSLFAQADGEKLIHYYTLNDGQIIAIPESNILEQIEEDNCIKFILSGNTDFMLDKGNIASDDTELPFDLPEVKSFKFSNKDNDQLLTDATGNINHEQGTIDVDVACIGKRLTADFSLTENAAAYINGIKLRSRESRLRYNEPVTFTVAYPKCWIYAKNTQGSGFGFIPLGHEYTVNVRFLTEHSTSQYSVPTIRINTSDGTMISSKDYYWKASFEIEGAGIYPDLKLDEINIKGRGNTSWNGSNPWDKNPYRLKFNDKQKPFGMKKGKSWVLLANKQSGSMTANPIAMRLATMMKTAGCNHIIPVELYINGNYRGSYNFTEKIGFAGNSVNIDDESNAAMIELDSYYDETYKFHSSVYNLPVNIKEPDFADTESGTKLNFDDIKNSFNSLNNALSSPDKEAYSNMIDIDAFCRAMLVFDLTRNTEICHPKSLYFYNENPVNGAPWVMGPVWDFDWAFGYDGHKKYFQYESDNDIFNTHTKDPGNKFMKEMLRNSEAVKKHYYEVWTEFMTSGKLDEIIEFCDDYYDFAKASFTHNRTIWSDGNGYDTQTKNAKTWLKKRAEYVYSKLTKYDIDIPGNTDDEEYGQPDGIEKIVATPQFVDVYSISGILLRNKVPYNELKSCLPSGLYIVNGIGKIMID